MPWSSSEFWSALEFQFGKHSAYRLLTYAVARLASLQTPVIERVRGYNDALKAAGLQEYSNVVGEDFSIQNGYIETKLLLSYKDRPTAILALSNTILLGEIKAITEARMTISKDLSFASS